MFNCVSIEFTQNCICKQTTFSRVPPKAHETVTIQMLVKPDAKLRDLTSRALKAGSAPPGHTVEGDGRLGPTLALGAALRAWPGPRGPHSLTTAPTPVSSCWQVPRKEVGISSQQDKTSDSAGGNQHRRTDLPALTHLSNR